jgi:methionyl aminopeptidase
MVILKSPNEIEKIRQSNVIVVEILEILRQKVEPGTNTLELDQISEELALDRDAKPAFKGLLLRDIEAIHIACVHQ